ncbi:hypothetical protein GCM10023340_34280 [Nocardioides marinquilinus]|uniref:Excalibur calcium-binding domain-containing protein n=1 Tax=Nocardioides marinquilinus TaxID=1210400 RepID=A0ABP9PVR9_9ACTN
MNKIPAAIAAAVLTLSTTAVAVAVASPSEAGGLGYSNCDALHRDYKHGVAKSRAAAAKQVRDGYGRPAFGKRAKRVYAVNHRSLDRDGDGTACEA